MNHADQAIRSTPDRLPAPEDVPAAQPALRQPILSQAEAARRMLLLAELQSSLARLGVRCVLARNHRIVLRYNSGPCEPSGLTDPQLHIFTTHSTSIATTNGAAYCIATGQQWPASDPAAAAASIHDRHHRW